MPALAVFFVMFGAILTFMPQPFTPDNHQAKAEATNFVVYRNAVNQYAVEHPTYSGVIATTSLDIPGEWVNLGGWTNRVDAGKVYVYGDTLPETVIHIARISESAAIGVKTAGKLIHHVWGDTGQTLPTYILDGQVVSMIATN